jgi:hypothetical protein
MEILMQIPANLKQSYGEFLSQFPWDWYGTLTFRDKVSSHMAFKRFNKWKVRLKKAAKHRIDYVLVIEGTCSRDGVPHLHFLIVGAKNEKPYTWEQRWYVIGGLAKIERYHPRQGASYYLGSKMVDGNAVVMFSKRLLEMAGCGSLAVPKKIPITNGYTR